MPSKLIAMTGRVSSWLEDPRFTLPVSCTVFKVEDKMAGRDGIRDSWDFASYAIGNAAGAAIHLSSIREKGNVNAAGLVASGPMSFGEIFSTINKIIRRGGIYKNGAIVLHLDLTHPDHLHFIKGYDETDETLKQLSKSRKECDEISAILESVQGEEVEIEGEVYTLEEAQEAFKLLKENLKQLENQALSESRRTYAWVKRCLNVEPNWLETTPPDTITEILKAIARGDLWLNKIRYDESGERLYANVCLEVYLKHRGTCLLMHGNLGQAEVGAPDSQGKFDHNLVAMYREGATLLCDLHAKTGVGNSGYYLPAETDRQVGFGLIGLANFLSYHEVSYKDFGRALKRVNDGETVDVDSTANRLALALKQGVEAGAEIFRANRMERGFAIAPTATCSYRYRDLKGFTTTPEIAPPINRLVDRDSGTFGVETYDYGSVETAAEVGWEDYFAVANEVVRLHQATGLFHGYSFNSWSDVVTYDLDFLKAWNDSPQTSLYYALQVSPDTLRKDDALVSLDEDFRSLFGFDEEPAACSLTPGSICSSCGE
jgi:hypothetical protein